MASKFGGKPISKGVSKFGGRPVQSEASLPSIEEATRRLTENQQLEQLTGGTPLDPITGEPVYSEAQKQADIKAIQLQDAKQRGEEAGKIGAQREELAKTGALTSAAAGAALVPVGLSQLGETAARAIAGKIVGEEALNRSFPQRPQGAEFISETAAQNPVSASVGQAVANILLGGRGTAGGLIQSGRAFRAGAPELAKQLLAKTGTEAAVGAALTPTIGTGIRTVMGQETTLPEILTEIIGGAAAGGGGTGKDLPSPGGSMTEALSKTLKESAERGVQKAFGPTKERFKAKAEVISKELLSRPFLETFALTRGGLKRKVEKAAEKAGKAIENFGELKGEVNPQLIVKDLEVMKKPFVVEGVNIDPDATDRIQKMQDIFAQFGDSITREGLREVRRTFGSQVDKAGGFFKNLDDASMIDIKKTITREIRKTLAKDIPELDKLNKQYSFLAGMDDVLGETQKRTAAQSQLIPTLAGLAGAGASGSTPEAAINFILFSAAAQAVRSPAWRLTSARIKDRLSRALASREPEELLKALEDVPQFDATPFRNNLDRIRSATVTAEAQ